MTMRSLTGPRAVTDEFTEIGRHYDLITNLSPGYHRQLAASARVLADHVQSSADPATPVRVADIGCGSGASTRALVNQLSQQGVAWTLDAVDGSAGMLESAREMQWPAEVQFHHLQAEDVRDLRGPYDAIFAAYLVRNVADRDAFLTDALALLRPGGILVVHDYGVAGRPLDVVAWTVLSWGVIIPLSTVVTRRPTLFTYLWRSVLDFDTDKQLIGRFRRAGFEGVSLRPASGWQRGMIRTTWGERP